MRIYATIVARGGSLACILALALACKGSELDADAAKPVPAARPAPIRSDSGGIEIVGNVAAVWRDGEEWRVDTVPSTTIGGGPGAGGLLTKLNYAIRLTNGTVVVLDHSAQYDELLSFYPDGLPAGRWARTGTGPGDLRAPSMILPSINGGVAVRMFSDRWVEFSDAGEYLGELVKVSRVPSGFAVSPPVLPAGVKMEDILSGKVPIPSNSQQPRHDWSGDSAISVLGPLPDGSWVGTQRSMVRDSLTKLGTPNRAALRITADRSVIDTIGYFFLVGPQRARKSTSHHGILLPVRDRIHYAASHEAEVKTYSLDGQLRRVTRFPGDQPYLQELPSFQNMVADSECHLWIQAYARLEDYLSPLWRVFDTTGAWLGTVMLPPNSDKVLQIGRDFVMILTLGADDVPFIRIHRLQKPGANASLEASHCVPPWPGRR
jgi:hypothetical protein